MSSQELSKLLKTVSKNVEQSPSKISVIGTGSVGMACAFAIACREISTEIALVDIRDDVVKGELYDMQHGSVFIGSPKMVAGSDYSITKGSKICVITGGLRQMEGETRLQLVAKNTELFKKIVPDLLKYSPNALIFIISNPCDILAYVSWKMTGIPINRVFSSGTNLDSARFRFFIAEKLGTVANNVEGLILGEHGDNSVASGSSDLLKNVHKETIDAAYEVIKLKKYTSWAIGLSCADICECIIKDRRQVRPMGTNVKGMYGIKDDVFMSVPCVIGANGVTQIINQPLTQEEISGLQKCSKFREILLNH
ncbi:hypothetical protein SNEBB_000804 [Seison nebaliae]|nr:hypothetical protein SNEBB_000804 [Seison nebaliae]